MSSEAFDRSIAAPHTAAGAGLLARLKAAEPAYQAFLLLRIGFTVAPIAFGVDKFANVMVHWPKYLAPWINNIAPGSGQDFMYFVGGGGDPRRPGGGDQAALWSLPRGGLARGHRDQPAELLRLLRHRAARFRPDAGRAHAGTAGGGVRPTAVRALLSLRQIVGQRDLLGRTPRTAFVPGLPRPAVASHVVARAAEGEQHQPLVAVVHELSPDVRCHAHQSRSADHVVLAFDDQRQLALKDHVHLLLALVGVNPA